MDISIGSYKFRLEICLLIIFVFWLLFSHVLFSCSKVGLKEGMDMIKGEAKKMVDEVTSSQEGFANANSSSMGPEFSGAQSPGYIRNPDTWGQPTLTFSPGTTKDAGVQSILDRKPQPIPLPEGELDMFATTPFKPECCPNTYSSSEGCACMDIKSYNYLINRGGNNVPYDIY
jgi:hypothetical protein